MHYYFWFSYVVGSKLFTRSMQSCDHSPRIQSPRLPALPGRVIHAITALESPRKPPYGPTHVPSQSPNMSPRPPTAVGYPVMETPRSPRSARSWACTRPCVIRSPSSVLSASSAHRCSSAVSLSTLRSTSLGASYLEYKSLRRIFSATTAPSVDGGHELDVLEVHSEDVELGLVCAQAVGQDAAPGSAPSLRGVARLRVLQQ